MKNQSFEVGDKVIIHPTNPDTKSYRHTHGDEVQTILTIIDNTSHYGCGKVEARMFSTKQGHEYQVPVTSLIKLEPALDK